MFKFVFAVLVVLASRALAFNITLGTQVLQANEILDIPAQDVVQNCQQPLSTAKQGVSNCNDNAQCLCQSDIVKNVQAAQQCMFEDLIARNVKAADPRVGSNPLLAAYGTSCKNDVQITLAAALTVPTTGWDGPFDAILPLGGTVVTVAVGGMLGLFALLLLSNLS